MKRNIFSVLFFTVSFALLNADRVKASTVLKVSFEEVCQGAELIFEGRVVSKESRLSPTTGNPFTYFTFEIIDVIKGSYRSNIIELGFMGGPKGEYVMTVSDMRMPELNEHGIYFVESLSQQQVHPFCGWSQGHYLVVTDKNVNDEIVVSVDSFDSDMTKASISDITEAPTLIDFKNTIKNLMKDRND